MSLDYLDKPIPKIFNFRIVMTLKYFSLICWEHLQRDGISEQGQDPDAYN